MTEQEIEALITPELLREIFSNSVVDTRNPKYVITLGGKVIAIQGKIFYDSKEQATRAFYNSFSWRVRSSIWRDTHDGDRWGWWGNEDRAAIWQTFKKVVKRDFGFAIKQI